MIRRHVLAGAAVLPAGLALGTALPASAADLTKVRVASDSSYASGSAMYAREKGFYAQAGLDADLTFLQSGAVIANAVLTGSSDFGSSGTSTIALARSRGLPVIIVAAGGLSTGGLTAGVLALKDAPFRIPADLNGKTLGVAGLNSSSQYTTQNWLDKNGGDSRTVKFLEVPGSQMSAAIEAHRVDAAAIFEPGITLAMATGKFKVLGNTSAAVAPRWLTSVWFSTDAYVQNNPDATRRFVAAIRQSALWSNAHRAESLDILVKYTKLDPGVAGRMARDPQGTELRPELIQPNLDILARYNALPNPVTVSQLVWSQR